MGAMTSLKAFLLPAFVLGQEFNNAVIRRDTFLSGIPSISITVRTVGQCHLELQSRGLMAFVKSSATNECKLYTPSSGQELNEAFQSGWDLYYVNSAAECHATWSGSCYMKDSTHRTYAEAVSFCRSIAIGAHVVDILSAEEESVVDNLITDTSIHLDATLQGGTFRWVTRAEDLSYTNWYVGEPSGGGEECTEMRPGLDWNDSFCTSTKHTVCEFEA